MERAIQPSSAEVCENFCLKLLKPLEHRRGCDVGEHEGLELINSGPHFRQWKEGDSTKPSNKSCEGEMVNVGPGKASLLYAALYCLTKVKHAS